MECGSMLLCWVELLDPALETSKVLFLQQNQQLVVNFGKLSCSFIRTCVAFFFSLSYLEFPLCNLGFTHTNFA